MQLRYIPRRLTHKGNDRPYTEKIAVIGSGPAGLTCAFFLSNMGYDNVTVFEKEGRPGGMLMNGIPSFRLEKDVVEAEIDVLRQMGVTFRCGVEAGKDITLKELRDQGYKAFYVAIGCQGGRGVGVPGEDAAGVETGVDFLRRVNLDSSSSVKDETGRFHPVYDENGTVTVLCSNVLLTVGQSIVWNGLLDGSKVELGRGNGAVADPVTYQTAEPDIFVGGDVYTGPKFAIDAIAAGREGAISIHRFVHEGQSLTLARNPRDFYELDKRNVLLPISSFDAPARQAPECMPVREAKKSFHNPHRTLTEEQVKKEASRCLGCGATVVDQNKCIGCGICTTKCQFDAIHLVREHPENIKMVRAEDTMKEILPYAAKRAAKIAIKKVKG